MTEDRGSHGAQARLQLTTKDSDLQALQAAGKIGPIIVPSSLKRYALSTLVNNLLGLEKPTPLEFLINGSYLRTSIDGYLSANGISSESILEAEFVRALLPPTHVASYEHDDWVSSVDVLSSTDVAAENAIGREGRERILSASYDGYLRLWDTLSRVLASSPRPADGGHTASIKCARFLSATQIASCGADRTVRLWDCDEGGTESTSSITPHVEFYGHMASVDAIAVHAPSDRVMSASADHSVGLWTTIVSQAPEAPTKLLPSHYLRGNKRRMLDKSSARLHRGPLSLLTAHTEPVSDVIFDAKDATVGYSASWDRSVRTWDLLTSTLVDTRITANALLSLTQLTRSALVATGSSGKEIKLIDPRESARTVSAMTLHGHTNAVVSLAPDPESEHGLVSGSYDGTCRVWDIRSRRKGEEGVVGESVYIAYRESRKDRGRAVGGEGVRVFDVCWDQTVGIVSASEDKRVQINQGNRIVAP